MGLSLTLRFDSAAERTIGLLVHAIDRLRIAVVDFQLQIVPAVNAEAQAVNTLTERIGQLIAPQQDVIILAVGQSIHIPGLNQGEDMSYTVPRDHQDEPFTLDPITATDPEGTVPAEFTERLESSDDSVVSIADGSFHFGTIGGAVVSRIVTYKGNDFVVSTAVFNVTAGDITFAGGAINVGGLTPDPEPEPVPTPAPARSRR